MEIIHSSAYTWDVNQMRYADSLIGGSWRPLIEKSTTWKYQVKSDSHFFCRLECEEVDWIVKNRWDHRSHHRTHTQCGNSVYWGGTVLTGAGWPGGCSTVRCSNERAEVNLRFFLSQGHASTFHAPLFQRNSRQPSLLSSPIFLEHLHCTKSTVIVPAAIVEWRLQRQT